MSHELPIVCDRDALRPGERERQKELFAELAPRLSETRELNCGFVFRFPAESLLEVAELMDMERRCCGFLRLRLEANAGEPDVSLTVEGPEGTKGVLRAELQLFS